MVNVQLVKAQVQCFIEAMTSYDYPRPSLSSDNEIFSSLGKLVVIINMWHCIFCYIVKLITSYQTQLLIEIMMEFVKLLALVHIK